MATLCKMDKDPGASRNDRGGGRNDNKTMGMTTKIFLVIFTLLFTTSAYATEDLYAFSDASVQARFQSLTHNVRCVVCQNQSLADSDAALATDLRQKIYTMMIQEKSDDEIINFLTERYGDFILFQPRFNKITMLLWFFPVLALLCSAFLLIRIRRAMRN